MRALTSLGARVRALPPGRADLLLAGAFLLETQVELSFLDASTGTVLAVRGLTLVMALGVAAHRRAPFVAAALVFAALTAMEQLGHQANTSLVGPYLSAFVVTYSFGANLDGRRLAAGVCWLLAWSARSRSSTRRATRGSPSSGAGWSSSPRRCWPGSCCATGRG